MSDKRNERRNAIEEAASCVEEAYGVLREWWEDSPLIDQACERARSLAAELCDLPGRVEHDEDV